MRRLVPVSAVIATRNRPASVCRTVESLFRQDTCPSELIIIDGSEDEQTRDAIQRLKGCGEDTNIQYEKADRIGAAAQRNQGTSLASQQFIMFCDDDVLLEHGCIARLSETITTDDKLGGVNVMITNQQYHSPGTVSRSIFTLLNGARQKSFAGKLIGPAVNQLPEDSDELPEVVPVEWLNTTCTMYRREALPDPPFDSFFTGYSFMEDVALSAGVARRGWKLANVRTARIYHDSQSSGQKPVAAMAKMELLNRHYVMTEILQRTTLSDYCKLGLWELFQLTSSAANSAGRRTLAEQVKGKLSAIAQMLEHG